ncbi:MAG: SufE family protein [Cytophagaceae bacterium]|nr:SufE family protein [Cytophagaceae bacterium]
MPTIKEIQDTIIDEFSLFDDSEDKYQYIIDLGNKLSPFDTKYKIPENEIKGCQSKVWLNSSLKDNKVFFEADSDGKIAKGVISILVRILSGQEPEEIVSNELYFIDKAGLNTLLSMNRANGLASMVKQMKLHALAYKTKLESKK